MERCSFVKPTRSNRHTATVTPNAHSASTGHTLHLVVLHDLKLCGALIILLEHLLVVIAKRKRYAMSLPSCILDVHPAFFLILSCANAVMKPHAKLQFGLGIIQIAKLSHREQVHAVPLNAFVHRNICKEFLRGRTAWQQT